MGSCPTVATTYELWSVVVGRCGPSPVVPVSKYHLNGFSNFHGYAMAVYEAVVSKIQFTNRFFRLNSSCKEYLYMLIYKKGILFINIFKIISLF